MDYTAMNERRKIGVEFGKKYVAKIKEMTKAPMVVQEKFLMKIISDSKDTEFGKEHGFDQIHSIRDYQEKVPLTTFDDYASYIERMANDGERGLISANDPVYYNKSSGTLGTPKRIPYSEEGKKLFSQPSRILF